MSISAETYGQVLAELADAQARVSELEVTVMKYRRSLTAHHEIATLSPEAIKESMGGICQICARAQEGK